MPPEEIKMDNDLISTVASTSPPEAPPDSIRALLRLLFVALAIGGLAGGLFQAYRMYFIVHQIVSGPHSTVTRAHPHRK